MSQITTHILDTAAGKPAAGVRVTLLQLGDDAWIELGDGVTDADGRVADLLADDTPLPAGGYKLVFETGGYDFPDGNCFYPVVAVTFAVAGDGQHYHIPLLLGRHGYTTYRGS